MSNANLPFENCMIMIQFPLFSKYRANCPKDIPETCLWQLPWNEKIQDIRKSKFKTKFHTAKKLSYPFPTVKPFYEYAPSRRIASTVFTSFSVTAAI